MIVLITHQKGMENLVMMIYHSMMLMLDQKCKKNVKCYTYFVLESFINQFNTKSLLTNEVF